MSLIESITVENLDEYKGIVAGLIDEIGIIEPQLFADSFFCQKTRKSRNNIVYYVTVFISV